MAGDSAQGLDHLNLAEWVNVPPLIGAAISQNPMLLVELGRSLSVEDLHDLLEVDAVNAHNERIVRKEIASRQK